MELKVKKSCSFDCREGGREVHSILALLLDRVNGQLNAPAAWLSRKEPLSPME